MKNTLLIITIFSFSSAYPQKLPNVQQASLRAPVNVKIDGNAIEWGGKFQAYNNGTNLFYTLANNDDDLYLIIQTSDRYAFNKIIDRGLILSIKSPKSGKSASVTFPNTIYTKKNERLSSSFGFGMNTNEKVPEEEIASYNKMLRGRHKFIKVDGIEGLDSMISVYNENGIRAAELFDNNKVYTLEMAVKLKLIGLLIKDKTKISYQLRVNSVDAPKVDNTKMVFVGGGEVTPEMKQQALADVTEKYAKLFGGNDFTGEYTLAK